MLARGRGVGSRERERERERRGGGGGFTMGTIAAISDPWEVLMLASKGR